MKPKRGITPSAPDTIDLSPEGQPTERVTWPGLRRRLQLVSVYGDLPGEPATPLPAPKKHPQGAATPATSTGRSGNSAASDFAADTPTFAAELDAANRTKLDKGID